MIDLRDDQSSTFHHVAHCLNYLRQWFLCTATADLEDGDFLDGFLEQEDLELLPESERAERLAADQKFSTGWSPGRIRGELVCEDWQTFYQQMDENSEQWEAWTAEWN